MYRNYFPLIQGTCYEKRFKEMFELDIKVFEERFSVPKTFESLNRSITHTYLREIKISKNVNSFDKTRMARIVVQVVE